jgi:ABC-type uncharacterized transport system substrate-binding protein
VLSEDSVSERNNTRILGPKYRALGLEPRFELVTQFEDWKRAYARAQTDADVLYLPTNGAIRGWDVPQAEAWVKEYGKRPAITCDDFMMPYAAIGLAKVAREQGEWAAGAALAILSGTSPQQIPVSANRQTECWVNEELARRAGLAIPAGRGCRPWRQGGRPAP